MDTYQLKWTKLQEEVFRFLCIKAGEEFTLRAIAKSLDKSPTAVSNALKGLEKEGMVSTERSKTINLLSIRFNRDNPKSIEMKRAENLKLIYESGLNVFLEESFPGTTIILFGSYSIGADVYSESEEKRSDIDIAIIGSSPKGINLKKFENFLERKININFYDSWSKIHKDLKNNILNGIVLSGSVEL